MPLESETEIKVEPGSSSHDNDFPDETTTTDQTRSPYLRLASFETLTGKNTFTASDGPPPLIPIRVPQVPNRISSSLPNLMSNSSSSLPVAAASSSSSLPVAAASSLSSLPVSATSSLSSLRNAMYDITSSPLNAMSGITTSQGFLKKLDPPEHQSLSPGCSGTDFPDLVKTGKTQLRQLTQTLQMLTQLQNESIHQQKMIQKSQLEFPLHDPQEPSHRNQNHHQQRRPYPIHQEKIKINSSIANPQISTALPTNLISYDNNNPSVKIYRNRSDLKPEENADIEELEQFAKMLKTKRISLGYTQGDVGLALGKLYGHDFSQTTISRFEALNLSLGNMCKIKPLLSKWLEDVDSSRKAHTKALLNPPLTQASKSAKRRKKRTSIDNAIREALERAFLNNPKPTSEEVSYVADGLCMEKEVVRIWFCNRRQKEKKMTLTPPHSPPHATGVNCCTSTLIPPLDLTNVPAFY